MKCLLALLILVLTSCATDTEHTKRMKISELSYATGCYHASIYVCRKYLKEPEVFSCYEEMNDLCPDGAKRFRTWLENGNK